MKSMAKAYDVIVVGDYFLDFVFSGLPRFMEPGREVFSQGFDMVPGGAYNSAAAMHRLDLRVGWAADFGNDDFSRFALEQARAEGLDERLFVHHPRPLRRITVAANYDGERAFLTYSDPEPAVPAALRALARTPARAVYVAGFYAGPFFKAARLLVRAKRMKIIMDGNSSDDECRLSNPAVRQVIGSVDLFMPNAAEAGRLTGCQDPLDATRVLGKLCPQVVVKDGPRGSYACVGGRIYHAAGISVTSVDTTGAGDCYNAGFIRAWLDGLPPQECLRWGNVVGGLSTTAHGGTGRKISLEDIRRTLGIKQS